MFLSLFFFYLFEVEFTVFISIYIITYINDNLALSIDCEKILIIHFFRGFCSLFIPLQRV